MIKAIIVDDEQQCIERLSELLNEHCHDFVELLDGFQSIPEGLAAIEKLHPELLFLDVQIGDNTGFHMLQQLKKISFEIIFTTAYDKYAVNAFKFSAVDYLLKPIDADDLKQAIEKVKSKLMSLDMNQKIETLLHNVKSGNQSKRITVATITGFEVLNVSDIIRCQSDVNYTTLFLKNNKSLMVAKTLKEFEELLRDDQFFRVHNSHLINLSFIKSYNKGKGGFVTLHDGKHIEVSTRRKDEFIKAMEAM